MGYPCYTTASTFIDAFGTIESFITVSAATTIQLEAYRNGGSGGVSLSSNTYGKTKMSFVKISQ